MSRHTRINNIKSTASQFKFSIAIGHGRHEPHLLPVLVPNDIWVVFMTRAGYYGHQQNTTSQKFRNLFSSQNKMRQLINGTLPSNEKPTLVTQKEWNWKNHIYPPNSICANHSLEFFDRNIKHANYDSMCGLWLPNRTTRLGYNSVANLQDILNVVRREETGKVMVFISGCRGDPAVSAESMRIASSLSPGNFLRLIGPQTYNVPLTNYIRRVRQHENSSSRYMRLKRLTNANGNGNSNNSFSNPNLSLNFPVQKINKYTGMVRRIQEPTFGVRGNRELQIQAARRYFPNFFNRSMTNENARLWIRNIKQSPNLANRMKTLWQYEPVQSNWKNNRNIARRILYKINSME